MRSTATLLLSALAAACCGCLAPGNGVGNGPGPQFLRSAVRNLVTAPVQAVDNAFVAYRSLAQARAAWREVVASHPDVHYSEDYAEGFETGFLDFLDAGGAGEPPPVPPFRYRLSCYQTPAGRQATLDWFAGFRHGAAIARATGLRELIVVPLSAPPINVLEQPYAPRPSAPTAPAAPPRTPEPEPREVLPPPKVVPPDDLPEGEAKPAPVLLPAGP